MLNTDPDHVTLDTLCVLDGKAGDRGKPGGLGNLVRGDNILVWGEVGLSVDTSERALNVEKLLVV